MPTIANTMVQNAGQTCSAGSRVLVERGAYDRVVLSLAERFSALTAGTPEMDLDLGPVINATQKRRIEDFFVAPRVYGPVPSANELATDEVFGPIELPFGGMEESGHGREKGFAALHDVSALRTTIVKHG